MQKLLKEGKIFSFFSKEKLFPPFPRIVKLSTFLFLLLEKKKAKNDLQLIQTQNYNSRIEILLRHFS